MATSSSRKRASVPDFTCDPVLEPQGEHRASIVWLHDKDDYYSDSVQFVKTLDTTEIKWICPALEYATTSFDFGSNITQVDREALDSAAKLVADHLLREPEKLTIAKGVGGFGMGAVVALHFATQCALGHYPINPDIVIGMNGWLSIISESTPSSLEHTVGAKARASSQKMLVTRGTNERVVPYASEEEAAVILREAGFGEVTVVSSSKLQPIGHGVTPNVTDEVKSWLENRLPIRFSDVLPD